MPPASWTVPQRKLANIFRSRDSPSEIALVQPNIRSPPSYHEKPSPAGSTRNKNGVHSDITSALRILYTNASGLTPLRNATEHILAIFDGPKAVEYEHDKYEEFSTEVLALNKAFQRLQKNSASTRVTDCTTRLVLSIECEAKLLGSGNKLSLERCSNGEEANPCFGPIISLFRQLRSEMVMSVDYVSKENLMNARLALLSPVKSAYYDSNSLTHVSERLCTSGTCVKPLSELSSWATNVDSASVYWMSGLPGTGKTTIATTLCRKLEAQKHLAATFFCNRCLFECRQVNRIIPTIAYQLAQYSMVFRHILSKILEKDPAIGSKDIAHQFELLLRNPLIEASTAMPKNLVVVLDALDECEDKAEVELLLSLLIHERATLPLKIFVTSQPEAATYYPTENTTSSNTLHSHVLEASMTQEDTKNYLEEKLRDISLITDQFGQLTRSTGGLFIYAATLTRSVRHFSQLEAIPLQSLLQVVLHTASKPTRGGIIDNLYQTILRLVFEQVERDGRGPTGAHNMRLVLKVILYAREPIDIDTIARLAGIEDRKMVLYVLHLLQPLLNMPEKSGLVSTFHSSFSDFMFNEARSEGFFWDPAQCNQYMADRCFETMKKELRFNICDLDSPRESDDLVKNIIDRVQLAVSPALSYSCRYWGYHLQFCQWTNDLQAALREFLSIRLLFWMEVMNLTRVMRLGPEVLLKARNWVKGGSVLSGLEHDLNDACEFVKRFATTPVSQSTPHLYLSALLFWPHSNFVSKHYRKRVYAQVEIGYDQIGGRIAPITTWRVDSQVRSIAYSSNGNRVVFGGDRGMIEVRDINQRTFTTERIRDFSDTVASSAPRLHPGDTGHASTVWSVALSPDGQRIASSRDSTIQIRTVTGDEVPINILYGHTDWVISVAFSPGGDLVASGSKDSTIRVWSSHSGELISGPLEGHFKAVSSLIFSPGGRRIASGSWDQTIRVWDPYNGTLLAGPFVGHSDPINSISFSLNGAYLVSASSNKNIGVWDSRSGLGILGTGPGTIPGHEGSVCSAVFSPDSRHIISGSKDNTIKAWDAPSGKLVGSPIYVLTEPIVLLAISPDGRHIISCSNDRNVQLWRLSDCRTTIPKTSDKSSARAVAINSTENKNRSVKGHWELRSDGWVVKGSSLLLWVPPEVRGSLYTSGSELICILAGSSGAIEVTSNLSHEKCWRSFYKTD
ncbi:unnamed protein product [Rhizoctonia solani]|uniref:Nephrocystin 3-like N-terminal domain-containing protein n=1 Tax=Rhizoctonia solani TaxID=456999 RepID=A0A8H2WTM8_9AGAM|nr:unnamed protein product [Rhizoctonia solani]